MENNYQEDGITLGELLGVIFKRKWLMLIITGVITILGLFAILAVYNPMTKVYNITFSLDYLGDDSKLYPDGSTFNYREIATYEVLQAAKESNSDFANIDIEEMVDDNDIMIEKVFETINNVPYHTGEYTITVMASYFDSKLQAKEFLSKVVNYPIERVVKCIQDMKYGTYLANYTKAISYDSQIDYLVAQKNLIQNGFQTLIDTYNEAFIVDGITLREYVSEINVYFANNKINTLYTELETNGYVKNLESYIDTVYLEIKELEIEKEDNDKTIANLKLELQELVAIYGNSGSMTQTYESFNEKIAELTTRNVQIERELTILNGYLDTAVDKDATKFEAKLEKYYTDLVAFTETYENCVKSVYEDNSKVIFSNNSVILSDGGLSIIIAFPLCVILGFVAACCLNLVLDLPKFVREKKEKKLNN